MNLPKNWTLTTIERVTAPHGVKVKPSQMEGAPFIGLQHVESHTTRLLGSGHAQDVKSLCSYFERGDVLYGRLRPYLNKVHMPDFDGLASGEFIVFRKHQFLDNAYLKYFLSQGEFVSFANSVSTGDRPRVDFELISGYPIPLPPILEQHRIVAEIEKQFSRLNASVAALERVRDNLKRYRASVLQAACGGRLVATEAELARTEGREYEHADELLERILNERRQSWEQNNTGRRAYKEPVAPDASGLAELPQGWAWATMPQLGELGRGKSRHRPRNDPKLLGGPYPFIQTGDIRLSDGLVTRHSQTYSDVGLAQSRLWPSGTLCITIAANIAETGVLSYDSCFPDSVVGFISHIGQALSRFLELFIRTQKNEIQRFAPATAQKNINLRLLSEIAVPLPPMGEQLRIVAEVKRRLSIVHQAEAVVDANLDHAERLRQSILRQAFCGGLLPQDATDEPASQLLERIRAERAEAQDTAESNRRGRQRTGNKVRTSS